MNSGEARLCLRDELAAAPGEVNTTLVQRDSVIEAHVGLTELLHDALKLSSR